MNIHFNPENVRGLEVMHYYRQRLALNTFAADFFFAISRVIRFLNCITIKYELLYNSYLIVIQVHVAHNNFLFEQKVLCIPMRLNWINYLSAKLAAGPQILGHKDDISSFT